MNLWILSVTFWLINHFYYGFIICAQSISGESGLVSIIFIWFYFIVIRECGKFKFNFFIAFAVRHIEGAYRRIWLFRDNENVTLTAELQSQFGGLRVLASSTYSVATVTSHRIKQIGIQISSIINLYLEFSRRLWLVISDYWPQHTRKKFRRKTSYELSQMVWGFVFLLLCARTQLRCARNFTESNQQINGDRVMWIYDYKYTASQQGDELKITNFIVNNQQEYHENVTHLLRTITAAN